MIRVPHDDLRAFVRRLVAALGAPEEQARHVAESLVAANLRGHDSHGVRFLPFYADRIEGETTELSGAYRIDPTAEPRLEDEGAVHAVVDGRSALGHHAARVAVDLAIEKAAEAGVALVGLRDASHLGRTGGWAERATDAGMVFAGFVNGQGAGSVAVPGGTERRLFTNPVCVGVPTFGALAFPILLDVATSQVAHGKLLLRAARGEPAPDSWAVEADGTPLTDPERFADGEGAIRPLGGAAAGYKGFGLSTVAELLAGIVGRGSVVGQSLESRGNAAAFLVVDPTLFLPRSAIEERVAAYAEYVRSSERSPEVPVGDAAMDGELLLPGEGEHRAAERRREAGIPLPEADAESLGELAAEAGVSVPQSLT